MDVRDYRFLLADCAALRQLIASCGSGDVIVRAGFEERIREQEEKLAACQGYLPGQGDACPNWRIRYGVEPDSVKAPVQGSSGNMWS